MDGNRPDERQFREIGIIIAYFSFSKLNHHFLLFQIDRDNTAKIAIKDLTLVIIDLLDHPIAHMQERPSTS
jgi:hypothetical protein